MIDRIRRRLTLGYVGILALIMVLFGVIVVFFFLQRVTAEQDRILAQSARNEARTLLEGNKKYEIVDKTLKHDITVSYLQFDNSGESQITAEDGEDAPMGLPNEKLARKALLADKEFYPASTGGPDGSLRVVSVPITVTSGSGFSVVVVQAAQSRQAVWDTVGNLIWVLSVVGIGALALALVGGLFMSRRAMRPVQDSFDRQRTFIADASHELKTPLTLIRADTEVLQRGLTDPDQRELADDLLSETDRMDAVLSDLLLLTRLDSGKVSVRRESFDLSRTIVETADRFATRAEAENVALATDVSGKLPARGDAERTGQILAALLDNALRFAPRNSRISVAGSREDGRVRATVSDNGPGIPPEHLPHIFDRFYRAEEARTRSGGGTGLGLSIARDLARAQGGELGAGNMKGGGAVFTLTLPAE
ncbi:MAG: sensor histidine kinase [Rubrobacteraceae bacterium]